MRKKIIGLPLSTMLSALSFFGALLLALCVPAEAQQAKKVHRVGYLDGSTSSGSAVLLEAFRQALRELGYVEGKNILIDYQFAAQKTEHLPELAAVLVHLKVDVIVATSTPPALAAKRATSTIPIVMVNVGDPVGAGLIASLARPGSNVTGQAAFSAELGGKRLEILKEVVPRISRVGVLLSRRGGVSLDLQLKEIRAAAMALELKLEEIETKFDPKGLESAFQTAMQKHVDALITASARPIFAERKRIVELASKYRLPAIYFQEEFVDAGGLMSYGPDFPDLYRRAAVYVDKILKGTKPADLPVEQPMKFELVINLKTAKQIGLAIPQSVLYRADKVIK